MSSWPTSSAVDRIDVEVIDRSVVEKFRCEDDGATIFWLNIVWGDGNDVGDSCANSGGRMR